MGQALKAPDQRVARTILDLDKLLAEEQNLINEQKIIQRRAEKEGMPNETWNEAARVLQAAGERKEYLNMARRSLQAYLTAIS